MEVVCPVYDTLIPEIGSPDSCRCCWAVERAADANRFGEMIHECWLGLLQLQHLVKCNAIESNSLKSCAETKTWRLSGKLENR